MVYKNIVEGVFLSRPNRFIAQVKINEKTETVHVKNTGRCKELLIPGCKVFLSISDNPNRKTKYDLIAVEKQGLGLVNIDSQAPNQVVLEWLKEQDLDLIKPEYTYGDSRLDFYAEKGDRKILIEVKGCTLEVDGIGYFPDAPTERGTKHLRELSKAVDNGYECYICYVIQMPKVEIVKPNISTDKKYADAYYEVLKNGVKPLFLRCEITPDSLTVIDENIVI